MTAYPPRIPQSTAGGSVSTLHEELLDTINKEACKECAGWLTDAVRVVVELHKPEQFGGVTACLACSPGMPPPVLIEWPCLTAVLVAREIGTPL